MRYWAWLLCFTLAALTLGSHLCACPDEWPMLLASLAVGLIALFWIRRAGICADPGHACHIPLAVAERENAQAEAGREDPAVAAAHPRPLSAIFLLALVGICISLTLAAAWMAFTAQAAAEHSPAAPALEEAQP